MLRANRRARSTNQSVAARVPRISTVLARVLSQQVHAIVPSAIALRPRTIAMMRAPDLACSIDGSMPLRGDARAAGVQRPRVTRPRVTRPLHVTAVVRPRRGGLLAVDLVHEASERRSGRLVIAPSMWEQVYRRALLWACAERIIALSLDEPTLLYSHSA